MFLKNTEEEDKKLVDEMKRRVEEEYKKDHPELAAKEVHLLLLGCLYGKINYFGRSKLVPKNRRREAKKRKLKRTISFLQSRCPC